MDNKKPESNAQREKINQTLMDIKAITEALEPGSNGQHKLVEKLIHTQQSLQLALEAAQMGTWEWDFQTDEIKWSETMEPLHGLKPGEFVSLYGGKFEGFQQLIHPSDRGLLNAAVQKAIQEKSYYNVEFRVVWPDGSIHWLNGQGRVFYDHADKPIRMLGVGMDITERKLAEEKSKQSEERFRVAIKNSPIIVFNQDKDLRYVWLYNNPSVGGVDEWILGKTDEELLAPDEAQKITAIKRKVLEQGTGTQAEIQMTIAGKLCYFMLTAEPLYSPDGTIAGITCAAFDITDRKQSEDLLQESEQRFRMMADSAPVLIWMSGTDALCDFFNKSWLDFTGRTFEQEKGNGWAEGVHPDDYDRCLNIYLSAFEARQPFRMEYRLRRADGEYRWLLDVAVPRRMPDGTFTGFIGSCIDITDRKQFEEQLRRSERLKQEIFENSADALLLVNAQTNLIEDYNQEAVRLFGFKDKQELIGKQARSLQKNPYSEAQIKKILKGLREDRFWNSELEYVSRTGYEFWGNAAITLLNIDSTEYFLVRIRDITERKKAEAEIERTQQEILLEKKKTEEALAIIEKDNLRKTAELEEARALQMSMLPLHPPDIEDLDIAMYMKTCVEVGGDYYDYKIDEQGTLTFIVGDATGHGLKAGIVVATVKSYFQTLANQCTVSELLEKISEGIQNLQIRGMYMGVTVIKINKHHMSIASSGMPPLYLYQHEQKKIEQISLKGLFLGSTIPFPYQYTCLPLQPGDTLLAMTDGLPELFDCNRRMLDYDCVVTCFTQYAHLPAQQIVEKLNIMADTWAAGKNIEDDIALLVIKAIR